MTPNTETSGQSHSDLPQLDKSWVRAGYRKCSSRVVRCMVLYTGLRRLNETGARVTYFPAMGAIESMRLMSLEPSAQNRTIILVLWGQFFFHDCRFDCR